MTAAALPDVYELRADLHARIGEWRTLLRSHVETGQQLLRRVLDGKLVLTPERDAEGPYYRFVGQGAWWKLLSGLGPIWRPIAMAVHAATDGRIAPMVASPTGFEPVFWP